MEHKNLKEKEVIINIDNGETSHGTEIRSDPVPGNKRGKKKSLGKFVSGALGFKERTKDVPNIKSGPVSSKTMSDGSETVELWVDESHGSEQNLDHIVPNVGKAMKALKPPRPPRGPSLDATDMRLVREIAKIATKKRERIERVKALKKLKALKLSSPSSPIASSLSKSSRSTISAMVITVLFFLVIIFQAIGSSNSSKMSLGGAPQPVAPETSNLISVQLHNIVSSNDNVAPNFASQINWTH